MKRRQTRKRVEDIPALTANQMREVERIMVEELSIGVLQMMESAGRALASLARYLLDGSVENQRIVVLAGKGNNGAGGLVAARHLANWGAQVCAIIAAPPAEYIGAPAFQLGILQRMNFSIVEGTHPVVMAMIADAGFIIDALIGYGLQGAPAGPLADLIRLANATNRPILALDAPSGLDATDGTVYAPCIRAVATLTLALPKVGLLTSDARRVVGDLYLADIGVPPEVYAHLGLQVWNIFRQSDVVRVPLQNP